jgi:sulfur carrier protein ThiS
MATQFILRDRTFEVQAGQTIRAALLQLDIIPETVLPVRNGKLLTDDEILREGETIRLIAVISGGRSQQASEHAL